METVPLSRRKFLAGLGVAMWAGLGCRTIERCKEACGVEPVACGPMRLAVTWNNQVTTTPDPSQGGKSIIGIAGRIYLFDDKLNQVQPPDGTATVTMYDHTTIDAGGQAKRLETWEFDAVSLKRLLKEDLFGWGYTLFLPWGSYRPDLTKVHVQVVYNPVVGDPIHAGGQTVTLDHSGTKTEVRTSAKK